MMTRSSKIPKEIRAVFLDAGGTLFRPYPSVGYHYRSVAARYGLVATEEDIETAFRRVWAKHDTMGGLKGHVTEKNERDFWYKIVAEVFQGFEPLSDFEACFMELFDLFSRPAVWKFFPETEDVLRALKKKGYTLGLISNWDSRLVNLCEGFDLDRFMDFYLISAVFGAAKPDPKIFQAALEKANVKAEESVHVGDSLEDDVRGAHQAGIRAIWLDRSGRHEKLAGHEREVLTVIRDLKELI